MGAPFKKHSVLSLLFCPPSDLAPSPLAPRVDNSVSGWESALGFLENVHMDGQLELNLFCDVKPWGIF